MLDYRVLGPLEVHRDGAPVRLASFRQRSLLTLLLIHANEVVSTDRIIDQLWGDHVVADPQNALWVLVSNLRSVLEPGRGRRAEGTALLTRAPGYVLQVAPDAFDVWRFEEFVREARALAERDPGAASLLIGEGLALWRGRAYDDVTYESFALAEIERLEESRLQAVEARVDADLRSGLADDLVPELEGLVREHPLRERLAGYLMMALYRSGRQAEALGAYQRLRARLAEDVGVDPSAELVRLEARILEHDPSLASDRLGKVAHTRLAIRGYELRELLEEDDVGVEYRAFQPSAGREVRVKVIRAEVADDPAFICRFEAEAEKVAHLEHERLVPLCDYWREPHEAYLVWPLGPRRTLADVVGLARLDVFGAVRVIWDVGSALDTAHQAGLVHGQLTPTSIRVDEDGRGYLTGFAVARGVASSGEKERVDHVSLFDAPERRLGESVSAASDIYSLGRTLEFALGDEDAGQSQDRAGVARSSIVDVIRRATAVDPGHRYPDVSSFLNALEPIVGARSPLLGAPVIPNPYKGLRAFEEADAPDFFGRDRVVERLVARLGDTGTRGRFVVLVGASGSGKSSVAKAGLLPALRQGAIPHANEWFIVAITPGSHPYEELDAALRTIAVDPPVDLFDQLLDGESGLGRAVHAVLPEGRSQLLLVIDQFEELFTQAPPAVAHSFLSALAAAIDDARSRIRVFATLRADFFDRPLRHHAIGEHVRRGSEVLTPMSPTELERAIGGPAERMGVRFEPGLVAQIVADFSEPEGALPLLQYALTELFDRRRGTVVELRAYRELGGVSGALVRRAEALYDQLGEAEKGALRQVLLRLVTIGEGTRDVRRRVLRSELTALGDPAVEPVLATLAHHRFVTLDRDPVTRGPTVDIAHEALLTRWNRLRAWIDDARDDLRQQRRLTTDATEWQAAAQDPELLARGTRLDRLAAWAAETDLTLTASERSYLEASLAVRDELRTADAIRHTEEVRRRRRARRRTRVSIAGAVVAALVISVTGYVVAKRNETDRNEAAISEARRLAAASAGTANSDPDLAMLLALQSLETSRRRGVPAVPEAADALQWAIQRARIPYPVADAPVAVRTGPDGPAGVFAVPLADVVDLARRHLQTGLGVKQCATYSIRPCPSDGEGLASPASAGPRALPAAPPPAAAASRTQPLAGTEVTVMGEGVPPGFSDELAAFEQATGIHVSYIENQGLGTNADQIIHASARVPDVLLSFYPTEIGRLAKQADLIDLTTYLHRDEVRAEVGNYVANLDSQDSGLYGIPMFFDMGGFVWYPVAAFERAGYTVPRTWDDLLRLSRQMVADGRTPWCIGFKSGGPDDGWPGTDWIEALVLRLGGVDFYDKWIAHQVPFNDPIVRQAMDYFGQIAFTADFVQGGSAAIRDTADSSAVDSLLADPPDCWMHLSSTRLAYSLAPTVRVGADIGAFALPPIAGQAPPPIPVLGPTAAAVTDRPEVREFMRRLLDPQWGMALANRPNSVFHPANLLFNTDHCRTPGLDDRTNALRLQLCRTMHDALAVGQIRWDASDLMPPAIGDVYNGKRGAFFQGMLDYVDQGPTSIDSVLSGIENQWRLQGGLAGS